MRQIRNRIGEEVFSKAQEDAWGNLKKCAHETAVPIEFSIRAGEVLHHLRSSLDHIAWLLSDSRKDAKPSQVSFPVIEDWSNKAEATRYKRQTEFITNTNALRIIQQLQPAGRPDPRSEFLWILHRMDIADKHRALPMMLFLPHIKGPTAVTRDFAIHQTKGGRYIVPIVGSAKVQADVTVSLNIGFAETSEWKERPVFETLIDLLKSVRDAIELFT